MDRLCEFFKKKLKGTPISFHCYKIVVGWEYFFASLVLCFSVDIKFA